MPPFAKRKVLKSLNQLKSILDNPIKIVVIPHTKPDADALGSCLALSGILQSRGHMVNVISPTDYPEFLNWMHGQSDVIQFNDSNSSEINQLISESDLIFCLDFCSLKRIEKLGPMVQASTAQKVLIDHHIGKEDFADFELWATKASSTAELIYDFLGIMDYMDDLNTELSECIYAGMMTDTGSFRFPSTSKKVHHIVGDLMDRNIDHSKIHRLVYDNNRLEKLKFLGYALSEKLVLKEDFKSAYIVLSQEELDRFSYETGDSEGLVNYALSLRGVVFAALIIQKDGAVKFSFRSVGDFDVNQYARALFKGGGHKNAAGGKLDVSLEEAEQKFLNSLKEYKQELTKQSELENNYAKI